MKHPIIPCLWFSNQAEEAVKLYISLFTSSTVNAVSHFGKEGFEIHGQPEGTVLTMAFSLNGQDFTALNGGPLFSFNPSVSFYVVCETETEVDFLWENLLKDGSIMMPLDCYEWSSKYGWLSDQFGVSWQISLDKPENTGQQISPALMFKGRQHALAEEAVHFYTSVFEGSEIKGILRYKAGEGETEGTVRHAQFSLQNQTFMIMGNSMEHNFNFNEALSFQVLCDTQDEIDYYWDKFSEGGSEGQCGWINDKYGLSWQVVPAILGELMSNPEKAGKVMQAFMPMKKLEISRLLDA